MTAADWASWGYSGNPFGDDECGKFYARAMSIWSVLLAAQGFIYDGPQNLIGFAPVWHPENHYSFFTAADGWGLFTQKRGRNSQTERIEMRYGSINIKSMIFELPDGFGNPSAAVTVNGKRLNADLQIDGGRFTITLPDVVSMSAGDTLDIRINNIK
ncbi:MAG: hypothetical protein ACYC27_06705 [Armatimonadota bacterium]